MARDNAVNPVVEITSLSVILFPCLIVLYSFPSIDPNARAEIPAHRAFFPVCLKISFEERLILLFEL